MEFASISARGRSGTMFFFPMNSQYDNYTKVKVTPKLVVGQTNRLHYFCAVETNARIAHKGKGKKKNTTKCGFAFIL